jgi:glucosamine-6-phosphate deaminase
MAHIMAAQHVVLLVRGVAKADILSAALTGPVTEQVPASFLQLHPRLTVVADTPALSRLPR